MCCAANFKYTTSSDRFTELCHREGRGERARLFKVKAVNEVGDTRLYIRDDVDNQYREYGDAEAEAVRGRHPSALEPPT